MGGISLSVFLVLLVPALLLSYAFFESKQTPRVVIGDVSFRVEIAGTQENRVRGLSGRHNLPDGHGMLFVFENDEIRNFWMKDMEFPLDLAFFNKDKVIVDVQRNLLPCNGKDCRVYSSRAPASYVLEVNAGGLKGIDVGSRVTLP